MHLVKTSLISLQVSINGMHCASCSTAVEKALKYVFLEAPCRPECMLVLDPAVSAEHEDNATLCAGALTACNQHLLHFFRSQLRCAQS